MSEAEYAHHENNLPPIRSRSGNLGQAFAVRFEDLKSRWDPPSFRSIDWHWSQDELSPIGLVLRKRKEKVDRRTLAFADLQPVTIHFDGSMDKRRVNSSREYTMDLFFAYPGDIVVSKIDLKNGAVGIVPDGWDNVVVTGHFAVYEPKPERVVPQYLRRLIQAPFFKAHLFRNKVGAEGRKEVKLDFFESLRVPLPALPYQQAIVALDSEARQGVEAARDALPQVTEDLQEVLMTRYRQLVAPEEDVLTSRMVALRWDDLSR